MQLFFQFHWLYPICAALLGLLVGSFLNVVIYRYPIMIERAWKKDYNDYFNIEQTTPEAKFNLSVPRSHCPTCKNPVHAIDNVPLFSWLILGGKCRYCKNPISIRYPLVELLTCLFSFTVAYFIPGSLWSIALVFTTFVLIALSLIDYDTMLLPDELTLPLMWFGILLSLLNISPISLETSIIGAMAGYLSLWSLFWLFKIITGKEGMGYGDFKLFAAIGALGGWQILPITIFMSALVAGILGLILYFSQKVGSRESRPFPFGPYIAIAGWICLIWGHAINHWYLINYMNYPH